MEIQTLATASLAQVTTAFNEAFSDYLIPLQFTNESMAIKMKTEGIVLAHSIGAFAGDRLVGFMLHGVDTVDGVRTVYNAGTGVIPAYRGKGLTAAMYRFAVPHLQKEGFQHHVLEVIDNNRFAKRVYDAVGFQPVRKLHAWRGTEPPATALPVDIRPIGQIPTGTGFHSMRPAWQNATASICRDAEGHAIIGAFLGDELVGYAAYVHATGRVKQCAVAEAHRRKGIGTALFRYMHQNSREPQLVVTNVDEDYTPATRFLEALKFRKIISLWEMTLQV